jgi:Anti-CBASS protein Acb1-like
MAEVSVEDEAAKSSLLSILLADDIVPGSEPSYELCKLIYLYHPLGAKMAEAPIRMAQSQPRTITVQGAPAEVADEFKRVATEIKVDEHILNLRSLSRTYGISSLVLGCEKLDSDKPIDLKQIWDLPIYFNVFDPLNMSGSVIMNQVPNTPTFNQVNKVVAAGKTYHRSRYLVAMNERPIYIAYTTSGFGFTGRSVYQRALFPLKSFIKTMIADDMIATKNGLLVAKMKPPGSVVSKLMQRIAAIKRMLLKAAHVGQVLSVDHDEDITTLNMQNVDGAGTFARDNILKNAATAADMPAKLLQNETMIGGMAEGTEDAKSIAKYIDSVREELKAEYEWFDNIVRYRAWLNPAFFARLKAQYPEQFEKKTHAQCFIEWCRAFEATWPSLLLEPESESIKTEEVKLEACINLIEVLFDKLGADAQADLIQTALDNISENKRLFPNSFTFDPDALKEGLEERAKQRQQPPQFPGRGEEPSPPTLDAARERSRNRLRGAVARLTSGVPA